MLMVRSLIFRGPFDISVDDVRKQGLAALAVTNMRTRQQPFELQAQFVRTKNRGLYFGERPHCDYPLTHCKVYHTTYV